MIDVFVNQDIALQVAKNKTLDAKEIGKRLEAEGVKVTDLTPSKKYVL